jgi:DNA polymerase III subunit gamma/tau
MENFVVSARKYRPVNFESVVGQSHITTTLENAIRDNHLAQAFLFCGPRGVGKTTCARILAKMINAEEGKAIDTSENSGALNIYELDAASNNSVDDIRNLVDQVRYPPQYGKYKVYIIDEVHMLSNAAFNAFLKTLEEPPSYAIFILATTEKHKVIPTILSRCQIFDFNRIQVKDIADHLAGIAKKEGIKAEPEALHLIAQKADGALRDALSMFDLIVTFSNNNTVTYKNTIDNLHILDYDYYFKMTDALNKEDVATALLTFDKIIREGFDGHNFIVGLSEHFRNLLVCKDPVTLKLLEVTEEIQKKYSIQANDVSLSFLMSGLNIANSCDLAYKSSKNPRLHVELALMKMGYLNAAINLGKELTSGEEVKKKAEPELKEEKSEKKEAASSYASIDEASNENSAAEPAPAKTEKKTEVKTESKPATVAIPKLPSLKAETIEDAPKEEIKSGEKKVLSNKFLLNELKHYWNEYAIMLKKNKKDIEHAILANRELDLDENFNIRIKLENFIQLDQLNSFKADFVDYLRKSLKNTLIMLEASIMPTESKKIIYTSEDKLKHLAGKYPIVDDLKKRLGLETDF